MFQNSWRYRLLKVVYGIAYTISILAMLFIVYQGYRPRPEPLSFNEFTALSNGQENGIMISSGITSGSWLVVTLLSIGGVLLITLIFWIGRKLFFYIYNDPCDLEQENDYSKIHRVAGIEGVCESPEEFSVGEAISDEGMFHTIRLLTEGEYDGQDELGDAVVHYNHSDLRSRGNNYADGVQDTFGLLSLVESGLVAIYSKRDKQFLSEIKKATYTTQSEERDRYFFPDGTCFFDIRTVSFRPSLK